MALNAQQREQLRRLIGAEIDDQGNILRTRSGDIPVDVPIRRGEGIVQSSSGRKYAITPEGVYGDNGQLLREATHDVWADGPKEMYSTRNRDGSITRQLEVPVWGGFGGQSSAMVQETTDPNADRMRELGFREKEAKIERDLAEAYKARQPNPALQPAPRKMSSTDLREMYEADDIAEGSQSAISLLKQAQKLGETAYEGIGADKRAWLMSNLMPGQTKEADATVEYDNLIGGQALAQLKAIFGGMPTEGERKILLELQASSNKTKPQRDAILANAIRAAERRLEFNRRKGQAIRSGEIVEPGWEGTAEQLPPNQVQLPNGKILTFPSGAAAQAYRMEAGL